MPAPAGHCTSPSGLRACRLGSQPARRKRRCLWILLTRDTRTQRAETLIRCPGTSLRMAIAVEWTDPSSTARESAAPATKES